MAKPFEVGLALLLALLALALPCVAKGQQILLPVEVGDGVLLTEGSPKPFTAAARLHPALGVGRSSRLQVGLTGAVAYANPDVSWQGGGRLQFRLAEFEFMQRFRFAELGLAAEALWGTQDRNPIGGALVLSLNRLIQATVRSGYDLGQEAAYVGVGVGTDLAFWLGAGSPQPEPPDPIEPRFAGCTYAVYGEARLQAQSQFAEDDPLIDATRAFLQANAETFLQQPSLPAARRFLMRQGLPELVQQIDATLNETEASNTCETEEVHPRDLGSGMLLRVFHDAWQVAVEQAGRRE